MLAGSRRFSGPRGSWKGCRAGNLGKANIKFRVYGLGFGV